MKDVIKNNLNTIILLILVVIGYFMLKFYFQQEVEREAQTRELIRNLNYEQKIDSIMSAQAQKIIDSLHAREEILFDELVKTRKENEKISREISTLRDRYDDIIIDRPDY